MVGERVTAEVVGHRSVGEATVRTEVEGTVDRSIIEDGGERTRPGIGIVGEYAGGGDHEGRIFVRDVGIIRGDWWRNEFPHGDAGCRDIGIHESVTGMVSEGIDAEVAEGRRVGEISVGSQIESPMARSHIEHGGDRTGLGVRIVGEQTVSGNNQGDAFVGRIGIVRGHRWGDELIDGEIHGHQV